MQAMIGEFVRKQRQPEAVAEPPNDFNVCWIMGTKGMLSKQQWDKRRMELALARSTTSAEAVPQTRSLDACRSFKHTGTFKVSMIASLYKGGKFIRKFLDNIASQSIFDVTELIIIDADLPEREWETIEEYQKTFPNIVYKRFNYRIGIYEAWNVGVELARGNYLTNANLDDLRRRDSIELQARMLDKNAEVDVVYQDFYTASTGT